MNIVFVNPEYPSLSGLGHGGIATYIYNMANACACQGHSVHILARNGTIPDPLQAGVQFHEFGHIAVKRPLSYLNRFRQGDIYWEQCCSKAIRKLLLRLHSVQPVDIVEVPEYGGLAHELSGTLPFPIVIHFHTPTQLIDNLNATHPSRHRKRFHAFEKKACLKAHAFKSPSYALRQYVHTRMGIPDRQITVIPTLMSTDEFDCIEKTKPDEDRIEILFAGRLERRKGAELLVQATDDILNIDARIHLTIAGETELSASNSYRDALERAPSPQNRGRLWILGPLDRKQVLTLYCRSSIFLMLSPFENAPNALLEAMSARLPIITTDGGGNVECITHRRNGLVFPPTDKALLIDHIRELIADPCCARKFAGQAYEDVKTIYNPQTVAQKTITFYRKVAQAA
ncbi:MAG: glycosyltransferase family 4 protein [Chitinispirillaceae bacterium]